MMHKQAMDLIVKVREISGKCPVYRIGDSFVLRQGYILDCRESLQLCMHSLASLMPYYTALSRGVSPKQLGLCREGEKAYVQCLDPCRFTGGGTVVFEVSRRQEREAERNLA